MGEEVKDLEDVLIEVTIGNLVGAYPEALQWPAVAYGRTLIDVLLKTAKDAIELEIMKDHLGTVKTFKCSTKPQWLPLLSRRRIKCPLTSQNSVYIPGKKNIHILLSPRLSSG